MAGCRFAASLKPTKIYDLGGGAPDGELPIGSAASLKLTKICDLGGRSLIIMGLSLLSARL